MSEYEISELGFKYLKDLDEKAKEEIKGIMSGIRRVKLSQEEEIQRAILDEVFNAHEVGAEPSFEDMLRTLRKRESLSFKEAETKFNTVLYGLVKSGYVTSTKPIPKSVVDYDKEYTLTELKRMCEAKGLLTSGDKKTLARRLIGEA